MMPRISQLVISGCFLASAATAQVGAPGQVSGPGSSISPDQLTYTLSASDLVLFGYNGNSGTSNMVNLSGNAAYVSGSEHHPTSFIYSGGYLVGSNGQQSNTYQNFGITQVLNSRKWTFVVGDLVSYLPNAPVFGLSGIPGVGDLGTTPVSIGGVPGQSILTNYGRRVTNTVTGGADYQVTGSTTIQASAALLNQRFLDEGIDNNQLTAGGGVNHRLDNRNSIGANYLYLRYTYPGADFSFTSNGLNGTYQHTFSRRMQMMASAGPLWTQGSNSGLLSSRLDVAATFSLVYTQQRTSAMLSYSRSTNTGSGVLLGSLSNNLNFTAQHSFSRKWSGSYTANYGRASSLIDFAGTNTTANAFYTGIQANRTLGRDFSAYGSYNVQVQSIHTATNVQNAFDGVAHILGIGITYAPRPIQFRRK